MFAWLTSLFEIAAKPVSRAERRKARTRPAPGPRPLRYYLHTPARAARPPAPPSARTGRGRPNDAPHDRHHRTARRDAPGPGQ